MNGKKFNDVLLFATEHGTLTEEAIRILQENLQLIKSVCYLTIFKSHHLRSRQFLNLQRNACWKSTADSSSKETLNLGKGLV